MQKFTGLRKAIALLVGLQLDANGQFRTGRVRDFVRRLGYRFAIAYVLPLCMLHVVYVFEQPRFGPASNVEETAYTYTSAGNYLKFGFGNSALLQDFSNSPFPEDHPFVYTHMPAGPDILTALLLGATDFDYQITRFVYLLLSLAGIGCYVLVVDRILRGQGLSGGGFALVFVWPWIIVQSMDRIIYSPFLLLAFAPVALLAYRSHGRWRNAKCFLAASIAFLASIYLEYSLLSGVMSFWLLAFTLKILPGGRRAACFLVMPALLGIIAHLVQNYIYLGPEAFGAELVNVLSNRITGHPSQSSLQAWYLERGLVHHGSQPISLWVLLKQIEANFTLVGLKSGMLLALCSFGIAMHVRLGADGSLVFQLPHRIRRPVAMLFRTMIAVGIPVLVPIVLFPAFAQEVSLRGSGANAYFLAILGGVAFGVAVRELWRKLKPALPVSAFVVDSTVVMQLNGVQRAILDRPLISSSATVLAAIQTGLQFVLAVIVLLALSFSAKFLVQFRMAQFSSVVQEHRKSNVHLVETLDAFKGKMFMTNINVPTIGFLVEYPGFGVCGPESVNQDGDISTAGCKISFARRYDYWKERKPEIFVFFRDSSFFPGFARCMPERGKVVDCMERFDSNLRKNFRIKEENELFTVFDLTERRRSAPRD